MILATKHGDSSRPREMPALPPLASRGLAFDSRDAEKWANLAGGNQVRTFIFTPANKKDEPQGKWRYRPKVERLVRELNAWVPNSQPTVFTYPQDASEPKPHIEWAIKHTPRGKIFVQYEPDQRVVKETKGVDGQMVECSTVKSALRIFNGWEKTPV